MIIENLKRTTSIKSVFYPGAGISAIVSLIFFLLGMDLGGFITAAFLFIWFLIFQFLDFLYISFERRDGRLILRYYSIVRFGRKNYSVIEFPEETLYDFRIEKSVFGWVKDLILVIKTKRGIAEYPPVSMAALDKNQQESIRQQLRTILKQ